LHLLEREADALGKSALREAPLQPQRAYLATDLHIFRGGAAFSQLSIAQAIALVHDLSPE
jgi:hypothetical protein